MFLFLLLFFLRWHGMRVCTRCMWLRRQCAGGLRMLSLRARTHVHTNNDKTRGSRSVWRRAGTGGCERAQVSVI